MNGFARARALEDAGRLAEADAAYRAHLDANPADAAALHRLALVAQRLGRIGEAVALFQKSLGLRRDLDAFLDFGALLAGVGQWAPAGAVYKAALALDARSIDARYGLALAHHSQGRAVEAEPHYRAVLADRPDLAGVWNNLGLVLQAQARFGEAVSAHREAVRRQPDDPAGWNSLGVSLHRAGDAGEAEAAYRKAIGLDGALAAVWHNLGDLLAGSGRREAARAAGRRLAALTPDDSSAWRLLGTAAPAEEAMTANARAVRIDPGDADARNNLANALWDAGRRDEAVAEYRATLAASPDHAAARLNLAEALRGLRDSDGALTELRALLARDPMNAAAWRSAGLTLMDALWLDASHAVFRNAVALEPGDFTLQLELGAAAKLADRVGVSIDAYRRAFRLDPTHDAALAHLIQQQKHACDWTGLSVLEGRLVDRVRRGAEGVSPYALVTGQSTLADQRIAAARWARMKAEGVTPAARPPAEPRDGRIRLGYLSSDFHEHAIAYLIAEVLERHDRARFAVTGYSIGMDDGGPTRRRIAAAMERFVDVRDRSDADAAGLIAADGIDILVDLNAYTTFARTPILAARPAPVQVNWLGFPGTMGADFMDYVIADPVVLPPGEEAHYAEAVVRLPHCYQPNDRRRPIAQATPSRADCGLPEDGFVFCCFNSTHKLSPALFDLWARLLHAVPGSVLWLFARNPLAVGNLRREAAARGLTPNRLVFAPPRPLADHLARHRQADLFLDTLPYNAHTTASDALWAGLPVLTCAGGTFAGRVAASLLRAVGLPDLVTATLADYEAQALRLARDPARLEALKERLAANRDTAPLFDTPRFVHHLEAAYQTMWDRHRAGAPPRPFDVPAGIGPATLKDIQP